LPSISNSHRDCVRFDANDEIIKKKKEKHSLDFVVR
jgi:hypothetical protein